MILRTMKRELPIEIGGVDFKIVDVLLKDLKHLRIYISGIDCPFDFLGKII